MSTSERVVIGMDPHKRSVTIEVMTAVEEVLGGGRFGTDVDGFAAMAGYVAQWPERVWADRGVQRDRPARRDAAPGRGASTWSTCRRSSRSGLGCSRLVRDARPMPPTPTRWRWSGPGCPGCDRWSPMTSSRGKSSNEAMRCLKRRLSDAVYRVMIDDLAATKRTDPGAQPGNDSVSSATGSQPNTGSLDKPLPGPVTRKPRTPLPAAS